VTLTDSYPSKRHYGERTLRRFREGHPLPDFHTVERIVSVEDVPLNDGSTNTVREYLVILRDDRYWQ